MITPVRLAISAMDPGVILRKIVGLTFTSVVSDESGHLSIQVDKTVGAPYYLINAMIITEN